jgi:hypothetical protein
MFNQNRIPSLGSALSLLVILFIILAVLFSGVFIAIAIMSAAIVPITWIFGVFTGQSYDRVCDNSEIVYRLNQVGKWTIVIGIAFLFVYFLFNIFI